MTSAAPADASTPLDWPLIQPTRISLILSASSADSRGVSPGDRVEPGERVHFQLGHSAIVPVGGQVLASLPERLNIQVETVPTVSPASPDEKSFTERLAAIHSAERGHWIDQFQKAGIGGDRFGCPNLSEQLRQIVSRPIDTVLCNALDAEAAVPFASLLATQFPAELAAGVAAVGQLIGTPSVTALIDVGVPLRQIGHLRQWCDRARLRLSRLPNPYPQSDPTLLLFTLLKRRLRPGRLPTEVGVLVLDAPAAIAIGSFVLSDRPAIHTFVAVRDAMTRQVKRAVAPTGTDFGTILKSLGFPTSNVTVRAGELLRDRRVSLNGTIGEGELSLHVAPTEPVINPDPCVRCGWCVEICPTRVQPAVILDAAQRHDNDMADRGGLSACIECGLCTYICPSKLPLLATIRQLKQVI